MHRHGTPGRLAELHGAGASDARDQREVGFDDGVADGDPATGHAVQGAVGPHRVGLVGHRDLAVGGAEGGRDIPAEQHPRALAVPDQDEAFETAETIGEQAVKDLLEGGTAIREVPESGHPRASPRRHERRDLLTHDRVPVAGSEGPLVRGVVTHGRAPSLSSRLARCRAES